MTVSSSTSVAEFSGNGIATQFSLPFRFFSDSDVQVSLIEVATGSSTPQVLGTNYTLTGAGDPEVDGSATGILTMLVPPPIGYTLLIERIMELVQPTDVVNQGRFFAQIHENAFDRLTMLIQQNNAGLSRALRWPSNSIASGLLPSPVPGKVLRVNNAANAIELVDYQPGVANPGWPVLSNIATLKGQDKTAVQNAFVSGYYLAGDGGGGNYYLDPLDTTTPDNGGTVIVATDGGRWKLIHTGTVSLRQFGALGDGLTDSSAAIQAAMSSGVDRVVGSPGDIYRHTSTLNINVSNFELDLNFSELLFDNPAGTAHQIQVGDGITRRNSAKIRRCVLTRAQAATSGAAINANYVGVLLIESNRIYGNNEIFDGIIINRGIIVDIKDNYIDNCINRGIYLVGTGLLADRTVDVTIRENRIEGGTTALSTWDYVEGVFCRDNIFFNTSSSIVAVNASSNAAGLLSFKFQENDFDTSASNGIFIDKVNNIQITGCWFSSLSGNCIDLRAESSACIISNNQIYPSNTGVRSEAADVQINGNLMSGGVRLIDLEASANRTLVSGNILENAQYGIDLSTAQNTNFCNNLLSNLSIQQIQGVGGTGTVIRGNLGDSTIGTGNFITVGASPFAYTAGARPEVLSVFGGTVSDIRIGATQISTTSGRTVVLPPGKTVTVTYSSVPFISRVFQ